MQPLLEQGVERRVPRTRRSAARCAQRAAAPVLAPSTFSGGEQQRVNIARGFIVDYPILLLDEPTASLDSRNSAAVVQLIERASGAAIVGIFHDEGVRQQVADRLYDMQAPQALEAL